MLNLEELAKKMYTAYGAAVGGKAYNGDPLPDAETFFNDDTKRLQADGWRAAAREAIDVICMDDGK